LKFFAFEWADSPLPSSWDLPRPAAMSESLYYCFRVHRFSAPRMRYPTSRCHLLNARVRRDPPRHIFQRVRAVRSSRPGATGGKYSGRPNLDRVRGLAALEDEDLKKSPGRSLFSEIPGPNFINFFCALVRFPVTRATSPITP